MGLKMLSSLLAVGEYDRDGAALEQLRYGHCR